MVDGIVYFTVPDNIWAIDARSAHLLWHYQYPPNKGDHIGQRGVAIYKDSVYFMSPDAHLICLNAKNGSVRWKVEVADVEKGYWATNAPLIVGNHVITGMGGDLDNLPMYLKSYDPETGPCNGRGTSIRPKARQTAPPAAPPGLPALTIPTSTWFIGERAIPPRCLRARPVPATTSTRAASLRSIPILESSSGHFRCLHTTPTTGTRSRSRCWLTATSTASRARC